MARQRLSLPGGEHASRRRDHDVRVQPSPTPQLLGRDPGVETAIDALLDAVYGTPVSNDGSDKRNLDNQDDNDHDSLFSGESDSDDMPQNGPYYDNAPQLDLPPAIDPSFHGYENEANQTSRYPDSSYQANPNSNPELIADLHNLVAAAHSVAEQEQIQSRSGQTSADLSQQHQQAAQAANGTKRKQTPDGSSKRTHHKRRKRSQPAIEDGASDGADPPGSAPPRPQGIHSSAALFRPASDKSKKWTRPPMNTLFNSFRMPPERFLQLQADAKDFMLDPEFPERRELVGVRGKADIKGVKLELARTVRQFLEDGAGERYFGGGEESLTQAGTEEDEIGEKATPTTTEHNARTSESVNTADTTDVPDSISEDGRDPSPNPEAPFLWSRDRERILDLCMPLLRRVVTNEKQRQYAESTRRAVRESIKGTEADADANLLSSGEMVSVQVYFVSVGKNGEAVVDNHTQGYVPTSGATSDASGDTQWTRICSLLGPEALTKGIRVQTAEGLVKVADQASCGAAVAKVLMAPWLERIVRIVVGGDEARAVQPATIDSEQP